jgi:hypothetical protein
MREYSSVLCLVLVLLATGCSSDMAKRTAYETLQNTREQQCLKNPAMDCGKRGSYDDYQRQRKELEQSR